MEVNATFEVTGADTPGWADPHPDRDPVEEKYSRCLDPGRYQILHARLNAWSQVLTARELARVTEEPATNWLAEAPLSADHSTEIRFEPTRSGGLTLVFRPTLANGSSTGFDVGVHSAELGTALLTRSPDCGCDACDSGSADLLDELDGWVLTVAGGGVVPARAGESAVTRRADGWTGVGRAKPSWLEESARAPQRVQRWIRTSWLA